MSIKWATRALRVRDAETGTARPFADGQIAAIAATNSLTLITRSVADFSGIENAALDNWHQPTTSCLTRR